MNDFDSRASLALDKIFDFFELSWPEADPELSEEVLTVTLPKGKQYLINKHGVTHQIWLASPFTGAHHFSCQDNRWICTRTGKELCEFLEREREAHVS